MIKLIDLIPSEYIKDSRDMQILTRIFEVVLNYSKTNSDLFNLSTKNLNAEMKSLTDLNLTTLGFIQTHNYNLNQLQALASLFREIIKNKGNIKSIKLVLELLSEIEDSDELSEVIYSEDEPYKIIISIPKNITELELFEDVLNYILPSGVSFEIQHTLKSKGVLNTNLNINNESEIKVYSVASNKKSEEGGNSTTSYIVNRNLSNKIPQPKIIADNNLYSTQVFDVNKVKKELQDDLEYNNTIEAENELKRGKSKIFNSNSASE